MWTMPNEDDYWEHVREEIENPRRYRRGYEDVEPVIEQERLFIDEEQEDIEKAYNCGMEKLSEGELQEIVEERKGIETLSARWDAAFQCISFTYEDKEVYAW